MVEKKKKVLLDLLANVWAERVDNDNNSKLQKTVFSSNKVNSLTSFLTKTLINQTSEQTYTVSLSKDYLFVTIRTNPDECLGVFLTRCLRGLLLAEHRVTSAILLKSFMESSQLIYSKEIFRACFQGLHLQGKILNKTSSSTEKFDRLQRILGILFGLQAILKALEVKTLFKKKFLTELTDVLEPLYTFVLETYSNCIDLRLSSLKVLEIFDKFNKIIGFSICIPNLQELLDISDETKISFDFNSESDVIFYQYIFEKKLLEFISRNNNEENIEKFCKIFEKYLKFTYFTPKHLLNIFKIINNNTCNNIELYCHMNSIILKNRMDIITKILIINDITSLEYFFHFLGLIAQKLSFQERFIIYLQLCECSPNVRTAINNKYIKILNIDEQEKNTLMIPNNIFTDKGINDAGIKSHSALTAAADFFVYTKNDIVLKILLSVVFSPKKRQKEYSEKYLTNYTWLLQFKERITMKLPRYLWSFILGNDNIFLENSKKNIKIYNLNPNEIVMTRCQTIVETAKTVLEFQEKKKKPKKFIIMAYTVLKQAVEFYTKSTKLVGEPNNFLFVAISLLSVYAVPLIAGFINSETTAAGVDEVSGMYELYEALNIWHKEFEKILKNEPKKAVLEVEMQAKEVIQLLPNMAAPSLCPGGILGDKFRRDISNFLLNSPWGRTTSLYDVAEILNHVDLATVSPPMKRRLDTIETEEDKELNEAALKRQKTAAEHQYIVDSRIWNLQQIQSVINNCQDPFLISQVLVTLLERWPLIIFKEFQHEKKYKVYKTLSQKYRLLIDSCISSLRKNLSIKRNGKNKKYQILKDDNSFLKIENLSLVQDMLKRIHIKLVKYGASSSAPSNIDFFVTIAKGFSVVSRLETAIIIEKLQNPCKVICNTTGEHLFLDMLVQFQRKQLRNLNASVFLEIARSQPHFCFYLENLNSSENLTNGQNLDSENNSSSMYVKKNMEIIKKFAKNQPRCPHLRLNDITKDLSYKLISS